MRASYKAYAGDRAWRVIGDRLQAQRYLCMVDNYRKIRATKQRTDVEKYSFVREGTTFGNACCEKGK